MPNVDYHRYMASREWAIRKQDILERAGGFCERCDSQSGRLQVHHLTYEHLGAERPDELLAVCKWCHQYESGKVHADPADVSTWLFHFFDQLSTGLAFHGWEWIENLAHKYGPEWCQVLSRAALDYDMVAVSNFTDEAKEEVSATLHDIAAGKYAGMSER